MVKSNKQKILLTVIGIVLVFSLFQLPQRNVNKDDLASQTQETTESHDVHAEVEHSIPIDKVKQIRIDYLNQKLVENYSNKNYYAIFADSLADVYRSAYKFDSAIHYYNVSNELLINEKRTLKLASAYFDAFNNATNNDLRVAYGNKAKGLYTDLLEQDNSNIDINTRLAVLYVGTERPPMKGIGMLKEIIKNNPSTALQARIYLGEFMMTVQKHSKAVTEFEEVVKYDPSNLKAHMYLVECFQYLGLNLNALEHLNIIDELNAHGDKYIEQFVSDKKKSLKNIN